MHREVNFKADDKRLNCFYVEACLKEIGGVRYTPSGTRIIEAKLSYSGKISDADRLRSIEMDLSAILVGNCCESILNCRLGEYYYFSGFLAPLKRGASQLIFHVQKVRFIRSV